MGCDLSPPARSADFYGRMDTVPGAARMAMRFTLLERLGKADAWTRVDLADLRDWRQSATGVKTFGYKQTVGNLRAGAAYKARISYRWLDAAGALVDSSSKETPPCRGPLPNLAVGDLTVRKGPTAETRTYRVSLANDGKAIADKIDVVLTVDKAVLDAVMVKSLAPGDSRTVSFTGPVCSQGVRVSIDPSNAIGELLEGDNAQSFACPA
jgi:hypothetical protein